MEIGDSISRSQPHLGTFVEICTGGKNKGETERAVDAAFAAVAKVHRLMSFHLADSDVGQLNREAYSRSVVVHPWTFQVLETALEMGKNSDGRFDITVAPALQQLGCLPHLKGDRGHHHAVTPIVGAIGLRSGNHVRFLRPGTKIDLGGIAKGFAVDRALDALREHNRPHGIVNAGGDLAVFGARPQTVHIRDPRYPQRSLCQLIIENAALASSALKQKSGFASGSVIDPKTQKPSKEIVGATVRAPTCMIADALTKCVMIAGQRISLERYDASALLVLSTGEIHMTSEWQNAISAAA